jgi:hypothetical protein
MPQNRFSGRFSVLQKVQSITLGNTCSGQKEMFHKQLGYLIKMTAVRDWLQSGILAFFENFSSRHSRFEYPWPQEHSPPCRAF